jgi:hypothetical protein
VVQSLPLSTIVQTLIVTQIVEVVGIIVVILASILQELFVEMESVNVALIRKYAFHLQAKVYVLTYVDLMK